LVFGCNNGDIGYVALATVPKRKNEIPFNSMDVFDGTKSEFDWTGDVYYLNELPHVLNPDSGYIVTANNRQVIDNVKIDAGATFMSTARAERVD
jgi:penicillin amidase